MPGDIATRPGVGPLQAITVGPLQVDIPTPSAASQLTACGTRRQCGCRSVTGRRSASGSSVETRSPRSPPVSAGVVDGVPGGRGERGPRRVPGGQGPRAGTGRSRRPKAAKLSCPRLTAEVTRGLTEWWSPEEISKRLVVDFPDDATMRGQLRDDLPVAVRGGPQPVAPRAAPMPADRAGPAAAPEPAPQQRADPQHGHALRTPSRSQ
jgi:hypothetical protein